MRYFGVKWPKSKMGFGITAPTESILLAAPGRGCYDPDHDLSRRAVPESPSGFRARTAWRGVGRRAVRRGADGAYEFCGFPAPSGSREVRDRGGACPGIGRS